MRNSRNSPGRTWRIAFEGVASLVSMQFYASDVPNEVGAVIRFSEPSQFTDHVTMIQ
jgi:hypothetical protein